MPKEDWVVSKRDGKVKKTIGAKFYDFQLERFNIRAYPYFVIMDPDGNVLTKENFTFTTKPKVFLKFLDEGLKNFRNRD
jgi:thiol:disulfide interchange protein DsbD